MKFLDQDIRPLGMGCWPIGGAMYCGDESFGYTRSDDDESIKAIHAALAGGIMLFDTAAAYGAGHSERLLARGLKGRSDAIVVTKIGIGIDEENRQISFEDVGAADVLPAIEACLRRLERDRIDLLLLHPNELPIEKATLLFDQMETAVQAGKIRAYGWSTDITKNAAAMAAQEHFRAIEHAMNLFFDADRMQTAVEKHGLIALIRSPLAMGVLSGKYDGNTTLPDSDVRASNAGWMEYFRDGKANPDYLGKLEAVREVLSANGRSLVQGALCWIWAKRHANIPIPGARTAEQIEGIAGALVHGPLSDKELAEIESLMKRKPDHGPV